MASSNLNRTNTTTTSNRKAGTFSAWVKRTGLSAGQGLITGYVDSNNYSVIYFDSSDQLCYLETQGGSTEAFIRTSKLFRDTSGYYNIVVAIDTTEAETDRVKFYVNGVQETALSSTNYPSDTTLNLFGDSTPIKVGEDTTGSPNYFDGLMSNIVFVDGLAYASTEFGEVDSTSGIWKFKPPSGLTYGTNGFWLKGENSGALGTDSSGNTNTFTTAGTPTQAIDTPSSVMATWNPLDNYFPNYNFSNGNTTATHPNASNYHAPSTATMGVSTGKWCWENKFVSTTQASNKWLGVGVTAMTKTASVDYFGKSDYDLCYYSIDDVYRNNAKVADLSTWTVGDIIGVALDVTNSLVYFYKNGAVENSGTGFSLAAVGSSPNGVYRPAVGVYDSPEYVCSTNFGNGFFGTTQVSSAGTSSTGDDSIWEYDCPTGYYGLNTKNINTYG